MLPSGVPTGGQDSWGQLRDLQQCCEQPRCSQEPWCLAEGVVGYLGCDQIPPVGCPANVGSQVSAKEGLSTPGTAACGNVSSSHHEAGGHLTSTPPQD